MQPLAAGFTTTTAQRQKAQSPCHQVQTGPRLALLATYKSDTGSRASQSSRDPNPTRHKPAPLKPPPSPTQPSQISFIPSQFNSPEPLRRLPDSSASVKNEAPIDRSALDHRRRQKSHICTLDIRVYQGPQARHIHRPRRDLRRTPRRSGLSRLRGGIHGPAGGGVPIDEWSWTRQIAYSVHVS